MPQFDVSDSPSRDIGEPLLFVMFENAWHARVDIVAWEHRAPGATRTLERFAAIKGHPVRRWETQDGTVSGMTLPGGCEITVYKAVRS